MTNITFDRNSLMWSGTDRDKTPYEIEIKNVNVIGLSKDLHTVIGKQPKLDDEGNRLFILPVDPIETIELVESVIETTEKTANPVSIIERVSVPALDSEGKQISFFNTRLVETTTETDNPVMVTLMDSDLGLYDIQKTDSKGNHLFYKEEPYGEPVLVFKEESQEIQKTNSVGKLLFNKTVTEEKIVLIEQEPELVSVRHDKFNENLKQAFEDVIMLDVITFEKNPEKFSYEDVRAYKEKQVIKGTFSAKAYLYETMQNVFPEDSSKYNADIGFDYISIPPGGFIQTVKLSLPEKGQFVNVYSESTNSKLTISVGPTLTDIVKVDANRERAMAKVESAVYVLFENLTTERIDLHAFAICV